MDAKYQIFWYLAAIPIVATIIAIDEGSITMTLGSPLMTLDKIKIKNKKLISGDDKVATNEGSLTATLRCCR
jgi:hypothetical protein